MPSAPSAPPPGPPSAPPGAKTKPASQRVPGKRFTTEKPKFVPPRIVLSAVEAWGKTSCVASAPGSAIIQAPGETGYETLLHHGRVPTVPYMRVDTWPELLQTLDDITSDPGDTKTLCLDAMGGFERLCHEHVCKTEFNGDWGERGFAAFQKGYDLGVSEWLKLLARLDILRDRCNIAIWLAAHIRIATFHNPVGPDYDRYIPEVHHKTWGVTRKWADAIFFGTFVSVVDTERSGAKKGKGIGRADRVLYTIRRDAWDAKNRYGMPECIDIPDDPSKVYETIVAAMKGDNQ